MYKESICESRFVVDLPTPTALNWQRTTRGSSSSQKKSATFQSAPKSNSATVLDAVLQFSSRFQACPSACEVRPATSFYAISIGSHRQRKTKQSKVGGRPYVDGESDAGSVDVAFHLAKSGEPADRAGHVFTVDVQTRLAVEKEERSFYFFTSSVEDEFPPSVSPIWIGRHWVLF